jgi:hypothetical protein
MPIGLLLKLHTQSAWLRELPGMVTSKTRYNVACTILHMNTHVYTLPCYLFYFIHLHYNV